MKKRAKEALTRLEWNINGTHEGGPGGGYQNVFTSATSTSLSFSSSNAPCANLEAIHYFFWGNVVSRKVVLPQDVWDPRSGVGRLPMS